MELVDYQYLEQVPFSKWTFALSDSLVRQIQQKLRKQREHVITLHPPSFYKIKHNINNDAKKKNPTYYRMLLSEYLYSWEAVGTVFGVDCHPALTQETFQF